MLFTLCGICLLMLWCYLFDLNFILFWCYFSYFLFYSIEPHEAHMLQCRCNYVVTYWGTDEKVHRSEILLNLICTDVMVQKVHYIYLVKLIMVWILLCSCIYLVFSSGMVNRTSFQMCGNLYLPMFLFRVVDSDVYGFFDGPGHILTPLAMILKFSTDVVWPVMFWCSKIGDGAFKCSLYLSSKVLTDSPLYSSSHSVLAHLNQYMI